MRTAMFATGCFVSFVALTVLYANHLFETCENLSNDGSFTCSNCMSNTDYRPKVPYRYCPMCGAYVIKETR